MNADTWIWLALVLLLVLPAAYLVRNVVENERARMIQPRQPEPEPAQPTKPADAPMDELDAFFRELNSPIPPNDAMLYVLQFQVLPEAVFANHPMLMRELENPPPSFVNALTHFRAKARVRCKGAPKGLDEDGDAIMRDMDSLGPLTIQHCAGGGYSVYVVTMAPPQKTPHAYFAAMVYRDDEPKVHGHPAPSTRYFTLEKAARGGPLFCEITASAHLTRQPLTPDKDVFVGAVFERLGVTEFSALC